MKTFLDWSAYDTYGIGDAYSGIPATGGNYAKAVAVCMHNRDCQRNAKGVMCPSYRITNDSVHSTEARVAAFKAALNSDAGELAFAHPDLAKSMDLCVSCKGCKKECPSAVDMTLIKTEYLAHRNEVMGIPFRSKLFGGLPAWVGHYRGLVRGLVQLRNRVPPVAWVAEKLLGITAKRKIPAPAAKPFDLNLHMGEGGQRGEVVLLVDTFAHHFEPAIAVAAAQVLARAGYVVRAAKPLSSDAEPDRPLCCGRTYLSMGMVDQAKAEGKRLLDALLPFAVKGVPIIGLEPSCLLSLRDELYSLGLGADVGILGKHLFLFEEFITRETMRGLVLPLKPLGLPKALVHGHCHQKAFGVMKSLRKVLGLIPGFEFELIEASCCGMAGSFGIEAEHYQASMAMAELSLLPAIRASDTSTPIIADGFSCRHQIEHGSRRKATHVALLLQQALAPTD